MLQAIKTFATRAEHHRSLFKGETWRVWTARMPVDATHQFEWRKDNTLWMGFRSLSDPPNLPSHKPWEASLSLAARALGQRLGFDGKEWYSLKDTPPSQTLPFISLRTLTPEHRPSHLHIRLQASWTQTGQGIGDLRFPWPASKKEGLPRLGTQHQGYQVLHREAHNEEGWLRLAWTARQPRQETWALNLFCPEASGQTQTWEINLGMIHGQPWYPNTLYQEGTPLIYAGQSWRARKDIEPGSFFDPTLFEPFTMNHESYFENLFPKEEFWSFLWNRFYGTEILEAEVPPRTEVTLGENTQEGIVAKIQDIYTPHAHTKKLQLLRFRPVPPFPSFSWSPPPPALKNEGPLLWGTEKEKNRLKLWLRPTFPRTPLAHTIEHSFTIL